MRVSWLQKIAFDYGFVKDRSGHTFWGKQGSGVLFVRQHPQLGQQMLLILRSANVEEPLTWGVPGGAVPADEGDVFASALRETSEEIGNFPAYQVINKYTWKQSGGDFIFTTFVLQIQDMNWIPINFNFEVNDAKWFNLENVNQVNLHFGVKDLIDNFAPQFHEESKEENV